MNRLRREEADEFIDPLERSLLSKENNTNQTTPLFTSVTSEISNSTTYFSNFSTNNPNTTCSISHTQSRVGLYEPSPSTSSQLPCSTGWSTQNSPSSNISASKSEITFSSPKIEEAVPLDDPADDLMDILSLSESMDQKFPDNSFPFFSTSQNSQALVLRDPTAVDIYRNNIFSQSGQTLNLDLYSANESQFTTPMYREPPPFPSSDLNLYEKKWIEELSSAGSVLHNPYIQIKDYQRDYAPICSAKLTQFFFYRMIRMCKKLKAFEALMPIDQGRMLKHSLLELLAVRSVLFYHKDRDAWCFVDVSACLVIIK